MLGGGGKSSCTLSNMLVLATVPVHESLANQHFYSTLLGRREGVCKKSTLCTLVKVQIMGMVPYTKPLSAFY